jgi:GNAT superfamily N-acetyltransferase
VPGGPPPIVVRPASEASWDDLQAVFGSRADAARCWCQRFRMAPGESWRSVGPTELARRLREQTGCDGRAGTTSGLVAYRGGEPVGWCAVAPRPAYARLLRRTRVPWEGRDEDRADGSVWAVTCLLTRAGHGRTGVSRALARAAVDHARRAGARALEAYPMVVDEPGGSGYLVGELHPGTRSVYADAGFVEVTRPTTRRAVMRVDL